MAPVEAEWVVFFIAYAVLSVSMSSSPIRHLWWFSHFVTDGDPYTCAFAEFLINMADDFFSSLWRILQLYVCARSAVLPIQLPATRMAFNSPVVVADVAKYRTASPTYSGVSSRESRRPLGISASVRSTKLPVASGLMRLLTDEAEDIRDVYAKPSYDYWSYNSTAVT
jgi:hypothetical protein